MNSDFSNSVFYLYNSEKKIIGSGFLVMPDLGVTSAGIVQDAGSGPEKNLSVNFIGQNVSYLAKVSGEGWSAPEDEDLAFLRFSNPVGTPFQLGFSDESSGHPCFFMVSADSSDISWARGILGEISNLPGFSEPSLQVYSDGKAAQMPGSPLVDGFTGFVVGMLRMKRQPNAALISETLQIFWPALQYEHIAKDTVAAVSLAPAQMSQPHPASLMPELRHQIGHQAELGFLKKNLDNIILNKKIGLVFINGRTGDGVNALGRSLLEAERTRTAILVTRFWPVDKAVEAIKQDARWSIELKTYLPLFESAQFLRQPEYAPLQPIFAEALAQKLISPDELKSLNRIDQARRLFGKIFDTNRPVILLLEDFDHAALFWLGLIKELTQQKPQKTGSLVMAALHSARAIHEIPEGERSSVQTLAGELSARKSALLFRLGPVHAVDIAAYLGRVQPDLAVKIHSLTGGSPLLIDNLWESLYRRGHVNQRFDGSWELDAGSTWVGRNSAGDYVDEILTELYEQPDPPSWDKATMNQMLACAAQEGAVFTADALAHAFQVPMEELLAVFDYLLDTEFEDGYDQTGLILDLPSEILSLPVIGWQGSLHKYRFEPLIVWRYFLDEVQSDIAYLQRFADSLAQLYFPLVPRAAEVLIRLYAQSGKPKEAKVFQSLVKAGDHFTALQNEIDLLEKSDLRHADPYKVQARLLELNIQILNDGMAAGISSEIIRKAGSQVISLAQVFGRSGDVNLAEFQLAELDNRSGHASAAFRRFEALVPVFETSGQEEYLLICLLRLGEINILQKRLQKAEENLDRALELASEHDNIPAIAMALKGLASVDVLSGRLDEAVEAYTQAIELFEQAGLPQLGQTCEVELKKLKTRKK